MCVHDLLEALLVDWELDGDVGEAGVDVWIGVGGDSGVVARVFVILGYGADAKRVMRECRKEGQGGCVQVGDGGDDLESEKLFFVGG